MTSFPKISARKRKLFSSSLSIYALQGIFIVLVAAIPFCSLILLVEIIHSKTKPSKVVPELQQEIKMSVKPSTSTGSPMNVTSENSVLTEVIE